MCSEGVCLSVLLCAVKVSVLVSVLLCAVKVSVLVSVLLLLRDTIVKAMLIKHLVHSHPTITVPPTTGL